jgi:hypothetical protein
MEHRWWRTPPWARRRRFAACHAPAEAGQASTRILPAPVNPVEVELPVSVEALVAVRAEQVAQSLMREVRAHGLGGIELLPAPGSVRRPGISGRVNPSNEHVRPAGAGDADVAAAGKVTEALERLERARGHLYSFHQLVGESDAMLDEAVELLEQAGHGELADALRLDLIGRNVVDGRWTFQIVEEFDDTYWSAFRDHELAVRRALTAGRRHVYEAEMKERRRTQGRPHHEARPAD